MAFADEYLAWTQQKQRVNASTAAVLLDGVADTNPDQYAGSIELGKAFNVPADLANEGKDLFNAKLRRKRNELMLGTAPVLASWLQNPENARVAHDDIESLSWFEGFARGAYDRASGIAGVMQQGMRPLKALNRGYQNTKAAHHLSNVEYAHQRAQVRKDGLWKSLPEGAFSLIGDIQAFGTWLDAQVTSPNDDAALKAFHLQGLADAGEAIRNSPKPALAQDFETAFYTPDGATVGQQFEAFGKAVMDHPVGALSWVYDILAEQGVRVGAAMGVGAVTKNPAAAATTVGGMGFAETRYDEIKDFLSENGLDLQNSADVERALNDPALMQKAAERGTIKASIVTAFDLVSMGIAGKTFSKNPVVESIAQTVQQAILGASGEGTGQYVVDGKVKVAEVIAEAVAEVATAPVDLGIAGRSIVVRRRKAKEAENVQAQMAELSQAAAGSKLKQRPGSKLQEWLSSAFGGTQKENVFVPAEVLATYFQANGIDPDTFFQDLSPESGKAFDLAVSTGGDVRIPTAAYTAKIVGSDLEPILQEHVRFDPEGMTFAEAKAFSEGVDDALQDAFDEAERERDYEDGLRSVEDRIYDDVVMALRGAGREQTVARNEAMVWPAFYRAMAERSGYTPEEFLAKFPLPKIRGAIPEGMQVKDVDQFNRTLAEARSFKAPKEAGSPFLEWLDRRGGVYDDGGELKSRDSVRIKRQGKKTLRIAKAFDAAQGSMMGVGGRDERHTIEGMMQAAIAEGFFADDPVVQKYQEAIRTGQEVPDLSEAFYNAVDAELRGVPLRNVNDPANRAEYFNELTDYLDRLGVSLDDSDEVIKAAVAADQAANGQVLEQRRPEIIDPLQEPGGDWRNAELAAETEDGERVTVLAGEWMDLINDRIRAAEEVLACVRG